jgi:histidinol-phosphate aminotransferase
MASTYPKHFNLEATIRPNILALQPYRCARDDYSEGILLDANENALGHAIVPGSFKATDSGDKEFEAKMADTLNLPLHRYPSPTHIPVKSRLADLRSLPSTDYVFLGVGSDEVLDLLIRIFVKPGTEGESLTHRNLKQHPDVKQGTTSTRSWPHHLHMACTVYVLR